MVIAETERLLLRRFKPCDAQFLCDPNKDPYVLKYTGDAPFTNVEKARDFIMNYKHYQDYGFGRWSALLKSKKSVIGWCGLRVEFKIR